MKNHNEHSSINNNAHLSHNVFDDTKMFAKKFDAPERDEWQKPDEVIGSLDLPSDAVVVEIGAGTGYFTMRLAKQLENGKVITFDSAPNMTEYLKNRVEEAKLSNVDVRIMNTNGEMPLHEKVDLILCVDAYHHLVDRVSYFSQLLQYLKQGGKIVIIDRPANAPESPSPEHHMPPELVKKEMEQAGFNLKEELNFLLPHQFYLSFVVAEVSKN